MHVVGLVEQVVGAESEIEQVPGRNSGRIVVIIRLRGNPETAHIEASAGTSRDLIIGAGCLIAAGKADCRLFSAR